MSNIDLHNHVIPPTIIDAIQRPPEDSGTRFEERDGKRYFNAHGRMAELQPAFYSVDAKVEWMDRVGLDLAAISVAPPVYFYGLSQAAENNRAARLLHLRPSLPVPRARRHGRLLPR